MEHNIDDKLTRENIREIWKRVMPGVAPPEDLFAALDIDKPHEESDIRELMAGELHLSRLYSASAARSGSRRTARGLMLLANESARYAVLLSAAGLRAGEEYLAPNIGDRRPYIPELLVGLILSREQELELCVGYGQLCRKGGELATISSRLMYAHAARHRLMSHFIDQVREILLPE